MSNKMFIPDATYYTTAITSYSLISVSFILSFEANKTQKNVACHVTKKPQSPPSEDSKLENIVIVLSLSVRRN